MPISAFCAVSLAVPVQSLYSATLVCPHACANEGELAVSFWTKAKPASLTPEGSFALIGRFS